MITHTLAVAREALVADRERPKIDRSREQLAFLPAAVEIAETPVSPTLRILTWTIVTFVFAGIIWAIVGRIDMVTVAQGQLVPAGQVKTVQSLEPGIVAKIHVANGDSVRKDDVLITLDPTQETLNEAEAAQQLIEASLATACLRAGIVVLDAGFKNAKYIVNRYAKETNAFLRPYHKGIDVDQIAEDHQNSILAELSSIKQAIAAARHDVRQKANEIGTLSAEVEGIRERLPLLAEREQVLRGMLDKTLTEHWRWLQAKISFMEAHQALRTGEHRLDEASAARQALEARKEAVAADAIASFQQRVVEKDHAMKAAMLIWQKAKTWGERRELKSPVDGTVVDLALHTTGGVLAAGDVAMSIVPVGAELRLAALALNQDIGFLRERQPVEVKIETFPYTRYGLLHGELVDIAANARIDEEFGAVYPINVKLGEQSILVGDQMISLTAGMTATAEIRTSDRRVIDFFLSPFQQYQDEALRER